MSALVQIITATDPRTRNRSLESACAGMPPDALLAECASLEQFRHTSDNLYERVRALFFLYAIHRFHLPKALESSPHRATSLVPFVGFEHLLQRRFEESIDCFLAVQHREGASDAISSALASGYHRLAFQTLADQVRRSVRTVRGNQ